MTRETLAQAVGELCARDADLRQAVESCGLPPMWGRRPGFASLARIVLEQQVSLASARAAFSRLQQGAGRIEPSRLASLSIPQLQRMGLTRQKAAYLRGMAAGIAAGELQLPSLLDDSARGILLGIHGVGPWTADIYLIMALRHPDVWPDGDVALYASMKRIKCLRSLPSPRRARQIAAAWSPWRSVAARILWHHYLCTKRGRI